MNTYRVTYVVITDADSVEDAVADADDCINGGWEPLVEVLASENEWKEVAQ